MRAVWVSVIGVPYWKSVPYMIASHVMQHPYPIGLYYFFVVVRSFCNLSVAAVSSANCVRFTVIRMDMKGTTQLMAGITASVVQDICTEYETPAF